MAVGTPEASVAFVSTYPPTVCGLATFTASLSSAIAETRGTDRGLGILRLTDDGGTATPRNGVQLHARGDVASLRAGTRFLNTFDAVSVQHEFGIYGGTDGEEVLDLVAGLDVPVATTFHTVLAAPTPHQRSIVERLAGVSQRSIVMSDTAARWLVRHYDVAPQRVRVIPHGAPTGFEGPTLASGDRLLMLTWGLIGPGKGLETAIEACAGLTDLRPLPRYLIAGATHPNVRRVDGEAYRDSLMALVDRLGLRDVVDFDDRYLDAPDLAKLVRSADLVVLPYSSVDQVTSGVLVEAISASKPVIATTFPHSSEVLATGAGILVPHDDVAALRAAMRRILTDHQGRARLGVEAGRLARDWYWPTIGRRYDRLLSDLAAAAPPARRAEVAHAAG